MMLGRVGLNLVTCYLSRELRPSPAIVCVFEGSSKFKVHMGFKVKICIIPVALVDMSVDR